MAKQTKEYNLLASAAGSYNFDDNILATNLTFASIPNNVTHELTAQFTVLQFGCFFEVTFDGGTTWIDLSQIQQKGLFFHRLFVDNGSSVNFRHKGALPLDITLYVQEELECECEDDNGNG